MKPELFIIDGNAAIHKAYHAIAALSTSKGERTNAVFGVLLTLLRLIKKHSPEYLVFCFDHPSPTFRHKEYPAYKATRKKTDDELKNQFPIVKEFIRALGMPIFETEGFEADDLIASAVSAQYENFSSINIVTGDKDAFQLVDEKVKVVNEQEKTPFTPAEVEAKFGVPPSAFADYLALVGDTSDNVPGVKGIGPVSAVSLLKEYGSLENIYKNLDAVGGAARGALENGRESAAESKRLVLLRRDAPVPSGVDDYKIGSRDAASLAALLRRCEFSSLRKDFFSEPVYAVKFARKTIIDLAELDKFVADARAAEVLVLDLETTSLDPARASIVGIACACSPAEAYYIPVGHAYLGVPPQLSERDALDRLLPLLEDGKILKIGHNLKYEMQILEKRGIHMCGNFFDTMVASYCLDPSRQGHNLKDVVFDALGDIMTEIEELIGKGKKQKSMAEIDVRLVADYASADANCTLRLWKKFAPEMKAKNLEKLFYDLEMPLVAVLACMEKIGVKIDAGHFEKLSGEFAGRIAAVEKEAYELAGEEFNLNSPKQLAAILFEKLKLPTVRRTKTGYSTDEEVLTLLSVKHDLPRKILSHRELAKLKSTYVDAILAAADPETRRIHSSFNQTVTATGRLSSSDPNLQNIPARTEEGRKIRRGFISEKGFVLLSADYSQIDLRVLAHLSGDPGLCAAFSSGEDIHARTARELFAGAPGDFSEHRRAAKTINFGIIYGMGPFALSQSLGIDQKTAAQYIENYFARYAGVKKWVEKTLDAARRDGSVSTLFNRIRYIPEVNSPNAQMRASAERIAVNTPVQGTSADIIKAAMINIHKAFLDGKTSARMLVQVHDELLFEVPDETLEAETAFIKKSMEAAVKLKVPVVADVKIGKNWDDMSPVASR